MQICLMQQRRKPPGGARACLDALPIDCDHARVQGHVPSSELKKRKMWIEDVQNVLKMIGMKAVIANARMIVPRHKHWLVSQQRFSTT